MYAIRCRQVSSKSLEIQVTSQVDPKSQRHVLNIRSVPIYWPLVSSHIGLSSTS